DPDVVPDGHRPPGFEPRTALVRVHRMGRRIDVHPGTEQDVRADPHRRDIEDDTVEVEEDVVAEADVAAVVAEERRLDRRVRAAVENELAQQRRPPFGLAAAGGVVVAAQVARPPPLGDELGIGRVVGLAGEHAFPLRPHAPVPSSASSAATATGTGRSPICWRHIAWYSPPAATSSWCEPDSTIRPRSSTWIVSACITVESRWAIRIVMRLRRLESSRTVSLTCSSVSESSAEVAS